LAPPYTTASALCLHLFERFFHYHYYDESEGAGVAPIASASRCLYNFRFNFLEEKNISSFTFMFFKQEAQLMLTNPRDAMLDI